MYASITLEGCVRSGIMSVKLKQSWHNLWCLSSSHAMTTATSSLPVYLHANWCHCNESKTRPLDWCWIWIGERTSVTLLIDKWCYRITLTIFYNPFNIMPYARLRRWTPIASLSANRLSRWRHVPRRRYGNPCDGVVPQPACSSVELPARPARSRSAGSGQLAQHRNRKPGGPRRVAPTLTPPRWP